MNSGPNKLTVQPGEVKMMGGTLQNSVDDFSSGASHFDSAMKNLLAAAKGDGAVQIGRLTHEWLRVQKQVVQALADLGLHVEEAGSTYMEGIDEQQQDASDRAKQIDLHTKNH